jgi:protein-S-isoprenylcysteine O-methyltransferase Ste14
MGYLAIGLLALFGIFCLGVRTWMHVRQTGRSPFLDGGASGKVAMLGFSVLPTLAIVADFRDALPRLVDNPAVGLVGAALALAGIVVTMWSQLAMGDSWRIGIDPEEHTTLVTTGPYRRVRNPIYTGMFAFVIGFALVIPNVIAIIGAIAVLGAIGYVVLRVEEPYLLAHHGLEFVQWKRTTGRFLPRAHTPTPSGV